MALENLQAQIVDSISRISEEPTRSRMTAELDMLIGRYNSTTGTEQEQVKARLDQLLRDAEIAAQAGPWTWRSILLIGLVLVAYVGGIWFYLSGLGKPLYAGVEATRAVIVFTIIVAMLCFGGLLIVSPLFSGEDPDKLKERFRLSREVFMVFAGVFGTIIGFYFGTGGLTPADSPALGAPSFADGKVTVAVEGGRAPFSGRITSGSSTFNMNVTGRTLSYAVSACPAGATIEVTDADVRRDEAQVSCSAPSSLNNSNPANTSVENAQGATPAPARP